MPVYFSTLETIKVMFDGLVNHIPDTLVLNGVNKFVPLIIHRVGNLNARIHTASTQMLLFLAADRRVGLQAIGPFALAPLKKSRSQAALYVGRLDLVQQMLRQFSSTQGLSVGSVMTFAAAALDSPDDKLRKAAVKVVCEIYRLQRMAGGNLDHKYLVSLKPAVMTKLEAKFAEVDAGLRGGGSMQGSRLAPLGPIISRQNLPCSARAEADGLCISSSSGTAAPLRKEKSKPPRPEGLQHKKPRPADRDENIWGPAPNRRTVFDDDEEGLMNEILYA